MCTKCFCIFSPFFTTKVKQPNTSHKLVQLTFVSYKFLSNSTTYEYFTLDLHGVYDEYTTEKSCKLFFVLFWSNNRKKNRNKRCTLLRTCFICRRNGIFVPRSYTLTAHIKSDLICYFRSMFYD